MQEPQHPLQVFRCGVFKSDGARLLVDTSAAIVNSLKSEDKMFGCGELFTIVKCKTPHTCHIESHRPIQSTAGGVKIPWCVSKD